MISIIGNVGNEGFALPMVQAYPTDPNVQHMLVWDPTNQALSYVPVTVDPISGNMTLPSNLAVGGTLSVIGAATLASTLAVGSSLSTQNAVTVGPTATPANQLSLTPGANPVLSMSGTQVVTKRQTGWTAMTGTPVRATRATGTVTLVDLAGIVMALQADLVTHGLIGP